MPVFVKGGMESSVEFENNGLKNSIAGTLRLVGILLSGAWNDKYKQPRFVENAAQEDFYQRLLQQIDRGRSTRQKMNCLHMWRRQKADCWKHRREERGRRILY